MTVMEEEVCKLRALVIAHANWYIPHLGPGFLK